MIVYGFNYLLFFHVNGQFLPELLDVLSPFDFKVASWNRNVFVRDVL